MPRHLGASGTWASRVSLPTAMRTQSWLLGGSVGALFLAATVQQAWALGTAALSSPANGGWVAGTPTMRWSAASSAASYTLTITPTVGAPWVKAGLTTTSYAIATGEALSTASGPYTWHVTAHDAASATSDSSTWSFFVDTTPPEPFAIASPAANAWTNSSDAQVLWNPATDTNGSGIGAYHVYVDGVLCSNPSAGSTGAVLYQASCTPGEGTHYWSVSVEDAVGNLTWCSECANGVGGRGFRIDDTGPSDPAVTGGTFQIASSNEPDYYNSPGDRMVDTGITITAGQPLNISASGNWCTLGCSSSIGCYSVTGSSSSSAVVPANCTPFSLVGRIGGTFYCIGTGGTFNPTTSGKLYLGINSEYTGCSTPTVTATVTGGRSFDLIDPADGATLSNRFPLFSWDAATDSGSGGVGYMLAVELDSASANLQLVNTTQTNSALPTPLSDGTYTWVVRASDAAKNRTESVVRWLTIDTARPDEFRLSSPADGACSSGPTPSLCWSSATDATGIANHQVYIDNILVASSTSTCSTPPVALSQGPHSWYVVQTDRAGNRRQSSDTRQLWVDYTVPSAPGLIGPANGASLVDPPVFAWTAANDNVAIKSYELYLDSSLLTTLTANTLSYLPPTDLALGSHTWYVRALDRCGQVASTTAWFFSLVACTPDGAQHPCPGYNWGPCRPGTRTCSAPGTWSSCSDVVAPSNETCNDIDDNCDGIVDNSTSPVQDNQCGGVCTVIPPYIWTACDGPDPDQCQEGHIACNGLNATACVESTPNNVEICNGRDDDCNGIVDDATACSLGGAGGMTGTGGTIANSGGTAGTSVVSGGTGGLIASTGGHANLGGATSATSSGGQINVTSGGNYGTTGSTNVATNVGGAGISTGGVGLSVGGMGVNSGGGSISEGGAGLNTGGVGTGAGATGFTTGGLSAVALGGSGSSLANGAGGDVAGQTSLSTLGGNAAAATTGGNSANVATGTGLSAGTSAVAQSGTAVYGDAGLDNGSASSESGCGCRVPSSNDSRGKWVLVSGLGLLLLSCRGRRANRRRAEVGSRVGR